MSQPQHMHTFCNPSDDFTQTSLYETNRNILLTAFSLSSSLVHYSNATIGLSPDTVYGMFLCRGDINTTTCSDCVQTAAIEIATNCTLNKKALIYYEYCMVRYSSVSFFSELDIRPSVVRYSIISAPNANRFNQTLSDKFDKLILKVSSTTLIPYFVEDLERVTQLEGSYDLVSMVQCSPDLDLSACTVCLKFAFLRVSTCCGLPSSALTFTPKCILRYRTFVLPSPAPSPSSLPPISPTSPPLLPLPPQSPPMQAPPNT
ncbi:Gnk2-homologous domain [Arabidopsis suecica]|uniref:Gnk2-homologous domain n=1 Tax=Arabidopsis suecica TaxID=45249 RepID=A0A8T2BLM2_ARASU|nr:Gnk2-homologous domain [Arabidopsis suecica]